MSKSVTVFLKTGEKILMDQSDWFIFNKFRHRVSRFSGGYLQLRWWKDGKDCSALFHRLLLGAKSGQVVDHINGNRLDNRRSNLRLCSQKQNVQNQRKRRSDNTSGYKGVRFHQNLWYALVHKDGKQISSKGFKDKLDAVRAYNEMAKRYYGEFAALHDVGEAA